MIRNKIEHLLSELSVGAYEREEVLALSLLCAASGESIFLLGLPGVAKSMIARRLGMAFSSASRFEYLMSRFSTPDEIFGPVSISKMKDEDTYERVIDGYLPTADVVFLDEIWKAGPAIQNSLLTALNEKIFRNGKQDIALPLKVTIAASNELPAKGEGLEALWDRFLFRYIVSPIQDKGHFFALLSSNSAKEIKIEEEDKLTDEELSSLLKERDEVEVPDNILEFLYAVRTKYAKRAQEQIKARENGEEDDEEESVPYVSDRRWKKIVGVLRSSALLNGRSSVDWSDCLLLEHLIWDEDSQIVMIQEDLANELVRAIMSGKASSGQNKWRKEKTTNGAGYWSPDEGEHYAVEVGGEMLYIKAADYKSLTTSKVSGKLSQSKLILRPEDGEFTVSKPKEGMISINNFSYPLRKGNSSRKLPFLEEVTANTATTLYDFASMVSKNLFTRGLSEYKSLNNHLQRYQKTVSSL